MNKEKISLLVKEVADIEEIKDDEPLISGGILDSFSVLIPVSYTHLTLPTNREV